MNNKTTTAASHKNTTKQQMMDTTKEQQGKMQNTIDTRMEVDKLLASYDNALMKRYGGVNIFKMNGFGLLRELYCIAAGNRAKLEVISSLIDEYYPYIEDHFSAEQRSFLADNIEQVFEYYVGSNPNRIATLCPSKGFGQPQEVTDFMLELASFPKGVTVYNPFAGSNSYTIALPDNRVVGEEKNETAWALGQIKLFINQAEERCNIEKGDSFESMASEKKYSAIISSPVYLDKKGQEIADIVSMLYSKLEHGGKLVCLVSTNFLYAQDEKSRQVREKLIDAKAIQWVVLLPKNIFSGFSAAQAVLVLTKGAENEKIALADATNYTRFAKSVSHATIFEYESFKKDLIEGDTIKAGTVILYTEIKHTILSPGFYLCYRPKNGIAIAELVEIVDTSNTQASMDNNIPYVEILSDNYLNCIIDRNSIEKTSSINKVGVGLKEECLLTLFIHGKAKVGQILSVSELNPVVLHSALIPFRIKDEARVTKEFMLRILLSSDFQKQADALSIVEALSKENFLNIEIEVPSLEEQESLCKEDARKSISAAERMRIEQYKEFIRDIRMQKHAIGQTIYNLNNWWKILSRARREGKVIEAEDAFVGTSKKIAVSEIFENMRQAIDNLQQQISRFDRGGNDDMEPEDINLAEFIDNYIKEHKSPLFDFSCDEADYSKKAQNDTSYDEVQYKKIYINFPKKALNDIFNNIVNNACSHGFENKKDGDVVNNIIRIDFGSSGTDYVVDISNNGSPLASGISEQDVFTYGKSCCAGEKHFGIGGNEVFRLMKEFGGDVRFISEPEEEFPIKYRLIFHNNNIL